MASAGSAKARKEGDEKRHNEANDNRRDKWAMDTFQRVGRRHFAAIPKQERPNAGVVRRAEKSREASEISLNILRHRTFIPKTTGGSGMKAAETIPTTISTVRGSMGTFQDQ